MPLANAVSFPIWVNALIFALAAGVIWFAGTRLTYTLDKVADRTGMDRAFIGMLLLGGITSLPELANVITASSIGNPALAVNNLLGSASINIVLLALADAFIGRNAVTSIVARPSTMMMAVLSMLLLIMIAIAVVVDDVALGRLGVSTTVIGSAAIIFFWIAAGHDERSPWTVEDDEPPVTPKKGGDDAGSRALSRLWLETALYGAMVFAAGYALSQTGDAIAEQAGLASATVGFALIGTATSLPELVTIIAALRLGRPEMAFGQVLGTNFVNLSFLPLGDAILGGDPLMNSLGMFEVVSALLGAVLIGVFLVGLLEHRDRTVFRMGIDSAAVLALFGVGAGLLAVTGSE